MTAKQKIFVQEYLADLNATAAARRAGYKDPNKGRQLVTKSNVATAIHKAMLDRQARTEISQDRVLHELAKVAFTNGTNYAKVVGGGRRVEVTDTDDLTEEQRAAVSGIKEGKFGIEVSTYDILVIRNYDGEDLGRFRYNLATYGAIKVRSYENTEGGVDTLTLEVNSENFKTLLALLKDSIIENARGYDAKDERMSSNPNQLNLRSMYSDIDLDANGIELEFQAAMEELLWFVNKHLANTGKGSYEGAEVKVIFDRDILINETEAINNCKASVGILSNETIVKMHPWVSNPEEELKRLKKEKEEETAADPYRAAFENNRGGGNKPGGSGQQPPPVKDGEGDGKGE